MITEFLYVYMKIITEQKGKLENQKILLRLDLNVPILGGKIIDNFKIEKILTTIGFLKKEGAKIVILSHIGRNNSESLLPVCEYLKKFFEIVFIEDIFSDNIEKTILLMQAGDIIMLENLRQFEGERKNDIRFTKKLVLLGDIYVNEAFAVSHRSHSSIVGLPKLMESYFGPVFVNEIEELKRVSQTDAPQLFILGGNKLDTKIPFIRKFLKIADTVFIGGALANHIFRVKGFEIGKSLVSDKDFDLNDLVDNKKIILPIDIVVESPRGVFVKNPNEVLTDEKIVDAGPKTVLQLQELINNAKFVLWNGPLGDYLKGFSDATFELIRAIADSQVESVVGGGDTEHCISKLGLEEKFDFISTGGGAMLKFIAEGTLPGIEAIENRE